MLSEVCKHQRSCCSHWTQLTIQNVSNLATYSRTFQVSTLLSFMSLEKKNTFTLDWAKKWSDTIFKNVRHSTHRIWHSTFFFLLVWYWHNSWRNFMQFWFQSNATYIRRPHILSFFLQRFIVKHPIPSRSYRNQ